LRESETRFNDTDCRLPEILADEKQNLELQSEILSDIGLVKEGLGKLKGEYREMILMRFVDELSFAEIAEATGKTAGTARVQTFRALQALKDLLEEKNQLAK
jgi:RNA polymerase sigma-70 factor (ECF subfamily)